MAHMVAVRRGAYHAHDAIAGQKGGTTLLQRGYLWVIIYLALLVVPLVVAAVGERPDSQEFVVEFSIALGFLGLAILLLQFLVSARIRAFTWPFGIDAVLQFHRHIAFLGLLFILIHPLILAVERSWNLLNPFDATVASATGMLAVALVVVQLAVSMWRTWFRLSYGIWHISHAAIAVAIIGFSFWHVASAGAYLDTTWKSILWITGGVGVVGLVTYTRVVKPARQLSKPYRVVDVRPEHGDAWTIELEPQGHPGIRFLPGQFAWLSIGTSPFLSEEHPFSLASGSRGDDGSVAFTIKEAGDFTSHIKETPIGTRAYIDGPYGAFTFKRFPAPGYVFVAGGIGITPIMSMLRSLAEENDSRPLILVNANQTWDDVTYREELEALTKELNLRIIHVLEDPPESWDGETGLVTRELLDRYLPPERHNFQYFLCGPPAMFNAVRESLRQLDIPLSNIQIEEFAFA